MTKKVTGTDLKKLIEGVLSEKKYYAKTGKPAFSDDLQTFDGASAIKDSDLFGGTKGKPNAREFEYMAKAVNDPDVGPKNNAEPLTFADLKHAKDLGSRTKFRKYYDKFINPAVKAKMPDSGSDPDPKPESVDGGSKEPPSKQDVVDIQHKEIGKIRARKLIGQTIRGGKKNGYIVSTDTKSVSSAVLKQVYDASVYSNLFADENNAGSWSAVLDLDGFEGDKNRAPILYWMEKNGEFTKETLKQFLSDLGDVLASGSIKKQYSATDLPNLFKQNPNDTALLADFETELAKIFKLSTLKGLTEVATTLEIGDFDFLFDNFEVQFKQALEGGGENMSPKEANIKLELFRTLLINTYKQAKGQDLKNALATLLAASKATGSARATMGTSSGYRITSRSASGGSVDSQIIKAFDNAFSTSVTFNDRVGTFNKYMAEINDVITGAGKVTGAIQDQFSKFIVLDLLQQIMYDFEASSAGWVFESWLAFMGFGSAIGAGYGAGDFTIQEGGKTYEGSAKLLQKGTTSQNFDKVNTNQTIKYVIGVKQTKVGNKFQGTTSKDRVGKLDIYLVDITKTSNTKTLMTHKGETIGKPTIDDGRIEIKIPKGASPDATLDLLFLQENEFQDVSGIIVKSMSQNLSKAMNTMSSLKANMDEYVLSFDKGDERQVYSDGARNDFNNLSNILKIAGEDQIFGVKKTAKTFAEGKVITASFLKNLISESFKR